MNQRQILVSGRVTESSLQVATGCPRYCPAHPAPIPHPKLFVLSHRDTVHYPRSDISACGKTLQAHRRSNFQETTEPCRTSLGIYQDDPALIGKRLGRIQAGEGERNLARNSRTSAPPRFLSCRTHIQVYRFVTTPKKALAASLTIRVRQH